MPLLFPLRTQVLVLNGSAEIHAGGTSGLKTITWWRHAADNLPNAEWVGKCDDDTLMNVPRLLWRYALYSGTALRHSLKARVEICSTRHSFIY